MLLADRKHGSKSGEEFAVDIKLLAFEVIFSYMIRGVQVSASEWCAKIDPQVVHL